MTDGEGKKAARAELRVKRPARAAAGSLRGLLEAQGFAVQEEGNLGLSFHFEGGMYYVLPQNEDEVFYHLLFPNFWALESEQESLRALLACDAVNREAKLVKLHTAEDDVWAGVECLHDSPARFVAFLPRYLGFVQESVRAFRDTMLAQAEFAEA